MTLYKSGDLFCVDILNANSVMQKLNGSELLNIVHLSTVSLKIIGLVS